MPVIEGVVDLGFRLRLRLRLHVPAPGGLAVLRLLAVLLPCRVHELGRDADPVAAGVHCNDVRTDPGLARALACADEAHGVHSTRQTRLLWILGARHLVHELCGQNAHTKVQSGAFPKVQSDAFEKAK